jgi:two-component system response regulator VicR
MSRRVFEPFSVGDFVFDRAKYAVSKRGQAVPLTPKEFSIVFALASRAGEVVSQQELVREAWGEEYSVEMVGLAVYVRRIRKKIEDDPAHPTVILTIWGEGYTFAVHD